MTMTSNLDENERNDFKGQFEEGEDYGLPQLDFSPLDPLEFNEISSKPVSSKYLIDEETQTSPDAKEPVPSPSERLMKNPRIDIKQEEIKANCITSY